MSPSISQQEASEGWTSTDSTESNHHSTQEAHPDDPVDESHFHSLQEEGRSRHPLPRFIEEAQEPAWKRRIPYPLRRSVKALIAWSRGPATPQRLTIKPLFPKIQGFPVQLLDTYLPKRHQKSAALGFWISLWILIFALVKRYEGNGSYLEPYGEPASIGCGATFWGAGASCGLNGDSCRPFHGDGWAFRCPASCRSYHLGERRPVGDQELNYQSFVIGGPVDDEDGHGAYRGDSWICPAAIHAGVISNAEGGCGVVRLDGSRRFFNGTDQNGISSIDFDSYFPKTFTFERGIDCKARDLRWGFLWLSATFSAMVSLFTSSAAVFFFTCFSGLFWHVGLVSDPPNHGSFRELFTIILGKYLPVMFVAWVMFDKMGIRRTLGGLTAQVEKTVLWLGACWVGALDNYVLSRAVPIQRLNGHDINQQPGAKVALAMIVIVVAVIITWQTLGIQREGRFLQVGKFYLLILAGICACLALMPLDLNLRLHHYLFALMLLPGTSLQTRPSLLAQGLLIGLFINGIARWGWDPILQTSGALRGDASLGSALPVLAYAPNVTTFTTDVISAAGSSITFTWGIPPDDAYYSIDGVSVLVNDVERFRGYFDADERFAKRQWTWRRKAGAELNEYFRWAYLSSTTSLDYTRAGVWARSLEWIDPRPGASAVVVKRSVGELDGVWDGS